MSSAQSDNNQEMVNLFNRRLREFNIDEIPNDARKQLQEWFDGSHKRIEEFYKQKLQELESNIQDIKIQYEEKKKKIEQNITEINNQNKNDDGNNNLKTLVDSIEQDLNDIENLSIRIKTWPLTVDNILIEKEFTLPKFSDFQSRFYYSKESSSALASSNRYLLMHQYPCLCLMDQNCAILKQNVWPHAWIRDICWAEKLKQFIVVTETNIYLVSELLDNISILNDCPQEAWFSCACSDESLYVSTCQWGSSIFELNLVDSFKLVNQWESPLTCANDEGINDIKYNNGTLALMINNRTKHEKRMELKSTKAFSTIWSVQLSFGTNIRLFTCCPLSYNEWLVIDGTNLRIYHITKNGIFKHNVLCSAVPYRANLFGSNILAIAAENDLNLYRIF